MQIGDSKLWRIFDRNVTCIGILIIATILSWIPRYRGPIDLRWDGGQYYVLGTSLAQGDGYRLLNEPGKIRAIQYPPGLPAIVAAHEIVLGSTDPRVVGPWLRRTWMAFSLISVILCFLFARRFLRPGWSLLVALGFLFGLDGLFYSTLCFAELPYALATLLFVLVYRRDGGVAGEISCAVLAVFAYLLRTVGIALLLAWVADAALRRRIGTAAVRAVVALVPIAAWQGYIYAVETSQSYRHPAYSYQRDPTMFYNVSYANNLALRDPFRAELGRTQVLDIAVRIFANLARLPGYIGEEVTIRKGFVELVLHRINSRISPLPGYLVLYLFGCGALLGICLQFASRHFLISLYAAMTLAMVCLTPWPGQLLRYIFPIYPFLAVALFEAVGRLGSKTAGRTAMAVSGVAILCGAFLSFAMSERHFLNPAKFETPSGETGSYRLMYFPPEVASVWDSLQWLRANAPRESVVAASMPGWVYLETGFRTIMPPFFLDLRAAERAIESARIDYIVLDHVVMEHQYNERFVNLIQSSPDRWRLVYAAPQAEVYARIKKPI